MGRDKYGHYVNDEGVEIKTYTDKSGRDHVDIYDRCPADNADHESIHIRIDGDGKGSIKDTNGTTDTSCYLTTACMRHYLNNFDDNCYELNMLRWFRDKFVSKEDIEHYYKTAPIIVESINETADCNEVYNDIYKNVISLCVSAIEKGNYELAYSTYKNSILNLEEEYARKTLQKRLVKALKFRQLS